MKRKLLTILTIVTAIAILGLTACGRGNRSDNDWPLCEETGRPIRSLNVRAANVHTAVIRQAASLMTISWMEQNKPYILQVEIDDHRWDDWEGMEARWSRLRTELMAGLGPDIIIYEHGFI